MPKFFFILIVIPLFISCKREGIFVHSQYVTAESLASFHVNTPDPRRDNPDQGKRILVEWNLPSNYLEFNDLHLEIFIHFRNGEEDKVIVPVCKTSGLYQYSLLNEDYIEKRGFLAYKVVLIGNGECLDEWVHQMWVETIRF